MRKRKKYEGKNPRPICGTCLLTGISGCPSPAKKNARSEGAVIVYTDEASFRQTPALHATWARIGHQPKIATRGERSPQKIFGAVGLRDGKFAGLHQGDYFQWET